MIWIHVSSVRKPRRWNSAGWRKDDRITSAVCLSCWLFEPLNQGKVYEKPAAGVSNSLFLLRFSSYKSAIRNKCFTCDLILCKHKHLGSTPRPGGLDCLESSRDPINLSCCKEKGFTCSLVTIHFSGKRARALWMRKENMNSKAHRARTLRARREQLIWEEGVVGLVDSVILLERSSSTLFIFFMPPLFKNWSFKSQLHVHAAQTGSH